MFEIFTPEGTEPDEGAVRQMWQCLDDGRAVKGALMADHHLGYSMPIGGVVAYDGAVSPSGVGYDIGCGNMAVRTGLTVADVEADLHQIMCLVQREVEFGVGRTNATPVDHPLFDEHAGVLRDLEHQQRGITQKARAQLGTVGSGNHYVDLLADEDDVVWIANHFGSRGLGHNIASGFLNIAARQPWDYRGKERDYPTVLPTDEFLGQFYLEAMRLAGDYARAGREYVIAQVLRILQTSPIRFGDAHDLAVHNHHNYAWMEHGLWVVRKGATPLTTGLAYIGGSMGDGAAIVRGKWQGPVPGGPCESVGCGGDPTRVVDVGALGSAPHGAGRTMSRTKAAGKFKKVPVSRTVDGVRTQKMIRVRDSATGVVDWPKVKGDLQQRGIVVLGSGADEAPEVYKSLDAVLAAHANVEVVHRLRTLGVVMAGDDVRDPYKD